YAGLRDQLRALASRQAEQPGLWEGLIVITGMPEWAARRVPGCTRGASPAARRVAGFSPGGRGCSPCRRGGGPHDPLCQPVERAEPPVLPRAPAGGVRRLFAVARDRAVRGAARLPAPRAGGRARRPAARPRRDGRVRRADVASDLGP